MLHLSKGGWSGRSRSGALLLITALAVINSHAQAQLSAEDYLRSAAAHIKHKEPDEALNDLT